MVNTIQVRSKGKKDISYRSEPNVDPESTTETYASGAFFVDSDRFRGVPFLLPYRKNADAKGTMVNVVFKQTDSIFGHERNQMSWPFISNQMKVSHWASTEKEVGKNSASHRFPLIRNRCDRNWSFPRALWKLIFRRFEQWLNHYSHWHEVRASWQLIDRIEKLWAEKWSTALWI